MLSEDRLHLEPFIALCGTNVKPHVYLKMICDTAAKSSHSHFYHIPAGRLATRELWRLNSSYVRLLQ